MDIKKLYSKIKKIKLNKITRITRITRATLRNQAYLTSLVINVLLIIIGLYAGVRFGAIADPSALTLQNISAIKQGKVRMIAGAVESIDLKSKQIVVNIDPLGVGRRYSLSVSASPNFIA